MLALCPLTVLPCTPLEQIDAALEAGYDAVGLRLVPTLATDVDVMADKPLRDAISKRLASTGIQVFDIETVRLSPRMDLAALDPLLAYAADLGARYIAVTGAPLSVWHPDDEAAIVGRVAEFCAIGARHGVALSLEFMAYRSVRTFAEAMRLRELAGSPDLRICVDALHFHRSGGIPADLTAANSSALSVFHICDAPAEAPDDLPHEARFGRLLPGEGDLRLLEMLAAVPADLPIGVEVPDTSRDGRPPAEKAREAALRTRALLDHLSSGEKDLSIPES